MVEPLNADEKYVIRRPIPTGDPGCGKASTVHDIKYGHALDHGGDGCVRECLQQGLAPMLQ
jgi:hypothetical protein